VLGRYRKTFWYLQNTGICNAYADEISLLRKSMLRSGWLAIWFLWWWRWLRLDIVVIVV